MRWLGVLLFSCIAACGSSDELKLCGQIPEGGCPVGRGGTCDDLVCAALYDCVEGAWTRTVTCPSGAGGGGGDGTGGGGGISGGGGCEQVTLDHTGEKSGCKPDLQEPDCPVAAAETCASTACLTGCVDFFLCTADGWTTKAFCNEDGELITRP